MAQPNKNLPARKPNCKAKKEFAKNAMSVSMGALVVSGFMRTPQGRALHVLAGTALVGFSIWHHLLYQKKPGGAG